ncbi:hypothetical protein J6590_094054 [Homalodisca vitripennis]|nr:hypothetical protein J6590_094054 [Homalodisca vitripennis]
MRCIVIALPFLCIPHPSRWWFMAVGLVAIEVAPVTVVTLCRKWPKSPEVARAVLDLCALRGRFSSVSRPIQASGSSMNRLCNNIVFEAYRFKVVQVR